MKLRLRLIGVGVALLLAQQLIHLIVPGWARPDLALAFALALGLRWRATEALLLAFATGYAVDALSAAPLGLHALLCGTACVATRIADRAFYLRAPLPWGIYTAAYVALNAVLLRALLTGVAARGELPWSTVLAAAPGAALLTGLLAAPLYLWLDRLDASLGAEEPWGSLSGPGSRL